MSGRDGDLVAPTRRHGAASNALSSSPFSSCFALFEGGSPLPTAYSIPTCLVFFRVRETRAIIFSSPLCGRMPVHACIALPFSLVHCELLMMISLPRIAPTARP